MKWHLALALLTLALSSCARDRADREYYAALREPKTIGRVLVSEEIHQQIDHQLRAAGIAVRDYTVDVAAFQHYLARADYRRYWPYYDGGRARNFVEKALEHYLAASFRAGDYFEITPSVGYETLLYDCMRGDPMLFSSTDMIEAGAPPFTRMVSPVLRVGSNGYGRNT